MSDPRRGARWSNLDTVPFDLRAIRDAILRYTRCSVCGVQIGPLEPVHEDPATDTVRHEGCIADA